MACTPTGPAAGSVAGVLVGRSAARSLDQSLDLATCGWKPQRSLLTAAFQDATGGVMPRRSMDTSQRGHCAAEGESRLQPRAGRLVAWALLTRREPQPRRVTTTGDGRCADHQISRPTAAPVSIDPWSVSAVMPQRTASRLMGAGNATITANSLTTNSFTTKAPSLTLTLTTEPSARPIRPARSC